MTSPASALSMVDSTEVILTEIAIRIQLNQTDYNSAIERYNAISNWIDRVGSPLRGRVILLYPQGSMAIGATIASRLRTDEFDIDIIAQLELPPNVEPHIPLDLLYMAIRGEPGSRYYQMTERNTRCITVHYHDDMHIDVTPVIRRSYTPERESWLFHSKSGSSLDPSYRLVANPFGFAEWFKQNTPSDTSFAEEYQRRAREIELYASKAVDNEPVPPNEPPSQKSKAIVVLQLLKRWRNVQYDLRTARKPPSILLAKLVSDFANMSHRNRLFDELLFQARCFLNLFSGIQRSGNLIHVSNPVCQEDILTDRWPNNPEAQKVFIRDLETLVTKIEKIESGCDLGEMNRILIELFGESPTADVFRSFNNQLGKQVQQGKGGYYPGSGKIALTGGTSLQDSNSRTSPRKSRKHTFYGG